ncbi:MAG: methionine--tRNA ligase [Candidatus Latescibacterota bacterium]|nr:MAG: methionine--tRNA ligase [Candidatus Latescibacterota bacterium]
MKTFYVTTAIDYVNARPHLGTAYEKIGADCLARYKRLAGFDTYFLMGTDEHSTNVEKEARRLGKTPEDYSAEMAVEFEKVWEKLHISYDQFIRTDLPIHKTSVTQLFQIIHDNGYIYQGTYKGFYCASCEEFVQDKDLTEGGLCPRHQEKAEWLEEKNYFFALSKFSDALKEYIEQNPEFIQPEIRRNEILQVIAHGLEDVSVSRVGKTWGVPLPIAEGHVVYVWFDALINYISALGYGDKEDDKFKRYWPADCHVIGKDITRFHCLIWPAMLMAADVPVPKSVFAHGFVYSKGTKMSKTLGNILDPIEMSEFFGGADSLRYLLLREIAFDRDGDFTIEQAVTRYNAELANELGNLFSRTLSMVRRYRKGDVPGWNSAAEQDFERLAGGVVDDYCSHMDRLEFDEALAAFWKTVQAANRYVEEKKPWELAKAEDPEPLDVTLRVLLEVLRMSSVLCIPFMPVKSAEMRIQLGLPSDISALEISEAARPGDPGWREVGTPSPLFPKIELPESEQ